MRFLLIVLTIVMTAPVYAQTAVDGYKAYDAGDYETAKSIMLSLAEQGVPKAMNAMGLFYIEGKVFSKNRRKGCDWYEKAALSGYLPALHNFASCFGSEGGRQRSTKAYLQWYKKAAEKDYLNSQLKLMIWYMDTNKSLAQKWGEKAAAQKSTVARVSLWMANLDDNILPVRFSEIACVFFKNTLLGRDWSACDD